MSLHLGGKLLYLRDFFKLKITSEIAHIFYLLVYVSTLEPSK